MNLYRLFDKKPEDTKILVAMSGGVDSSVVAAILKQLGYNLVGCTLQLAQPSCGLGACCTGRDLIDVQKICADINIPHVLVKARNEFKEQVIQRTVNTYAKGLTPSPCVWCNSKVRFDFLYQEAMRQGCDGFVTGHYAYITQENGNLYINAGVDPSKDQSYFLSMLSKNMLNYVRFPLGNMHKTVVRRIAAKLGIHVATKSDSQDLCFVKDTYTQTLWNLAPDIFQPGDIVNTSGKVIGSHDGIVQYTPGQRKGIKIANEKALYVVDVKQNTNEVIVGDKEEGLVRILILENVNMFADYKEGMFVMAKVRARSGTTLARLWKQGRVLEFVTPIYHPARGQFTVMYIERKLVASALIADFTLDKRRLLEC